LIRSFFCLQQTGEIDNLIVSWEQSIWLCCVQVPRCGWQNKALDEAPYKLSRAVAKLASITLAFSYWIDIPWFCTEEKLAAIFIKPSLGVPNGHLLHHYTPTSSLALFITAPSYIYELLYSSQSRR
jgi:hypothetical protein